MPPCCFRRSLVYAADAAPGGTTLDDLGLESDSDTVPPDVSIITPSRAPWPPSPPYPIGSADTWKCPPRSLHAPLPLRISGTPISFGARAARVESPTTSKKDLAAEIVRDYLIGHEDMAMIYLSPDPFYGAFKEKLDLRKFDLAVHGTAGLNFLQKNSRLYLASMEPGTPGARIP